LSHILSALFVVEGTGKGNSCDEITIRDKNFCSVQSKAEFWLTTLPISAPSNLGDLYVTSMQLILEVVPLLGDMLCPNFAAITIGQYNLHFNIWEKFVCLRH
jgi:hypothetical protein